MAFPIAHGLLGAALVTASAPGSVLKDPSHWRKKIFIGAVLAISPDLDFILTWFLGLNDTWHRGFSHSLVFAVIIGALTALLIRSENNLRWALIYSLAVASHGLLDILVSLKSGVELFWPITSKRIALGLFDYPNIPNFNYYASTDIFIIRGASKFVLVNIVEVLVGGALLFFIYEVRRKFLIRGSLMNASQRYDQPGPINEAKN
jgi:inner membrane protein